VNQPSSVETVPYVPPGHPVRRFVVALALAAALLGLVWWSGIGRPRISIDRVEASPEGATLTLSNDGRGSLELRALTFEDPRLEGETVELPPGSLGGGESVQLVVRFTAACTPTPSGGYYVPLRVTAHTAIGLDRTITAGDVATIGDLVCHASVDVPE
jgi:hypothetical protein